VLLENARLKGPYIMVGASFGGSIVQLFEKNHPELVSALVLVDGRSKEFSSRFEAIAPAAAQSAAEQAQDISGLDDLRLLSATLFALDTRQTPPEEMPPELRQLYADLGRLTKNIAAGAKENIVDLVSDQQMQEVGFIGEKPLVVISHGQKTMFNGLPEAQSRRAELLWIETQGKLAEISTNSRSVVAEQSGHDIQYEQPNLIARQIEFLVVELKSSRP
jgi:pimeloyl-ACP methyl ester carboxylesterase